jgi:hypothetical protein
MFYIIYIYIVIKFIIITYILIKIINIINKSTIIILINSIISICL